MAKMTNPLDRMQMMRLARAHEWSRRHLEKARTTRKEAVTMMVGQRYGREGSSDKVPINLLELFTNIYLRFLASGCPKVLVTSTRKVLRAFALEFETAVNHVNEEIGLQSTMEDAVLEALYSHIGGVVKVGITSPLLAEVRSFRHDAGQPFADCIDSDDWTQDMTVKARHMMQFAGDRYSLPLDVAQDLADRGKDVEPPQPMSTHNEMGDRRLITLQSEQEDRQEGKIDEEVELWDFWLPREEVVLTFQSDPNGEIAEDRLLRVVEWSGPEGGPYHYLGFNRVPGTILPYAPIQFLVELHDAANVIFNKVVRQGTRAKQVHVVRPGQEDDATRLTDAEDGSTTYLDGPGTIEDLIVGGPDAALQALTMVLTEQFDKHAGNLSTLGGLQAGAETLGQEEILGTQASQRLQKMQDRVVEFAEGIDRAIGDHLFYDPLTEFDLVKRIPGSTTVEIPFRFRPDLREGDFTQFNLKVSPFSIRSRTPQERLRTIQSFVERVYIPLAPIFEQQGVVLDMEEMAQIYAKYSNTPEIRDIFRQVESRGGEMGSERNRPTQSPVTSRTNIRASAPAGSRSPAENAVSRLVASQ